MSMKVCEISDKREIAKAMELVFDNFTKSEKQFYERPEWTYAKKSLVTYDVFNIDELERHIVSSKIKLFVVFDEEQIIAVSALELDDGKILFMSFSEREAGRLLVERMAEELENMPEKRLVILAFVGQEKSLVSLGFMRINPSVFKFFGVKFIAMRYDYAQIDIER